jgi:hypothetical protein
MDRPVVPALDIFARAVERIDDPDALLRQPLGPVRRFLRKHAVPRPPLPEHGEDQLVGDEVSRRADRGPLQQGVGAQLHEEPSRRLRGPRRKRRIVQSVHLAPARKAAARRGAVHS